MSPLDRASLEANLVPPLDAKLCSQLLDEFISLERRFVLRDWEPATLDGGQFAEAAARIVYHQDSANVSRQKGVNSCLKYIEDPTNSNTHRFPDRKSSLHLARIIRSIYKFRSDRGAIHIDPDYTANQLDAKLVLENARWILAELLRVFWSGDRMRVSGAIQELVRHHVPAIGAYGDKLVVQRTDLSAEEEVLVLLHYAGQQGMTRRDLGRSSMKSPSAVTRAIGTLSGRAKREIIQLDDGSYCLTDNGVQRVLSQLGDKLLP